MRHPRHLRDLFLWLAVLCAASLAVHPAAAQDANAPADDTVGAAPDVAAGHSYHGDAFNEGPRQKAYLMGGTGGVHFPATVRHADAQAFIDQGVGQLHGFWYFEAERSFRQAAAIDPDCAVAYWGMAMANVNNAKRARGFMKEAVQRKDKASEREGMYIDALDAWFQAGGKNDKDRKRAYAEALQAVAAKFPDDVEAKAFLALQYWLNRELKSTEDYDKVEALIQEVLQQHPMHPVHHYRIHLWDSKKAQAALTSAARCGQASPGIAHMWHMPGHIYSRLKRYADAAWQQEASARVDHAHMMRDRVLPDQIHNYAHNNEWLTRDLVNVGRVTDALDLAMNMVELPRHPNYNTLSGGSAAYGRQRLFQVLQSFELWDRLIALSDSAYLEPTDIEGEQVARLRARGVAFFYLDRPQDAQKALAELEARLAPKLKARDEAGEAAAAKAREEHKDDKEDKDGKADKAIEKARNDARHKHDNAVRPIEQAVFELQGLAALRKGEKDEAITLFNKAGDVPKTRLARYCLRAGDADRAVTLAQEASNANDARVHPLANLVFVLHEAGKADDAAKAFAKLRAISGTIDLDAHAPVFDRLAPVAQALNLPADWRVAPTPADDVGDRPDLAALGPFRWQPSPAPDWALPDADGKPVALESFKGKPVVVIFYLGFGCVHCVQQLHVFAPQAQAFADEGIAMVAVSTDNVADLKKSLKPAEGEGGFPIPLVSDASLTTFRAYRCYDDFEHQPLHGTFLIDAKGLVRWQDISYEPFNDAKFLLAEAKRLLAQ